MSVRKGLLGSGDTVSVVIDHVFGEKHRLQSQTWIHMLTVPLTQAVDLRKLTSLSEPYAYQTEVIILTPS